MPVVSERLASTGEQLSALSAQVDGLAVGLEPSSATIGVAAERIAGLEDLLASQRLPNAAISIVRGVGFIVLFIGLCILTFGLGLLSLGRD